jgi:pilus assembly protein CpaC
MMKKFFYTLLLPLQAAVVLAVLVLGIRAHAQSVDPSSETRVVVPLYKSLVLNLAGPATRVSIGNPDVADILILRASQLYVLGKDLGTTNVILWDKNDNLIGNVSVEVTHDLSSLKEKLHQLLPAEPIEVYSVQRSIVLRGVVSSPGALTSALQIASGYLAQVQSGTEAQMFEQESASRRDDKTVGQVINMMQVGGGQQVMLEVKVAEIARVELKRLNAQFNAMGIGDNNWNFGGVNGGATFPDVEFTAPVNGRLPVFNEIAPWGPAVREFAPNPMSIQNQGLWASFLTNNSLFNLALDAARENGLAKILAEPTLTTLTGEEAEFLSGGEFPIPVPRGTEGITVEFREFGVGLKFLPVVLGSGNVNVKLNIAVSELVNANSIGITTRDSSAAFIIPSLAKRSASATVELREGQTIAIAGLINENTRSIVTKFPGLGELPVLGALFRSQEFINNETELVILVTPHLAKPIRPDRIRLPTDSYIKPSDADFYLMGRIEGRRRAASTAAGAGPQAASPADATTEEDRPSATGTLARYGHQIQ